MDASDIKLPICVDGTIEATKTFASISNTPFASPKHYTQQEHKRTAMGYKVYHSDTGCKHQYRDPNLEKLDIFFTRDTKNTSKAPHVEASDIRIMAKKHAGHIHSPIDGEQVNCKRRVKPSSSK